MKVLFLPEVSQQFVELVDVLYDKGYMSFLDQALDYSESLFREIQSTLPFKVHRKAPKWFSRFGKDMDYSVFPKMTIPPGMSSSTFTMLEAKPFI